jgi:UDP-glucose 4-epimerase
MRILVTGGAGFIGANFVRAALEAGHEMTVLDDLSTGSEQNLETVNCRLMVGSILDQNALAAAIQGIEAVLHLAALPSVPRSIENPMGSHEANATGTLRVLEAARRHGVSHVTVASSSSVYGLNPELPKHERAWTRPMSPYAVSKLATEQYALAYQQSFGLSTTAFRFFNVYGPLQSAGHAYAAVIPSFLDRIKSGLPLRVFGDGNQSRDFTYVETVCQVLLASIVDRTQHPEPINLAFGTNTTLNNLIEMLGRLSGRSLDVEYAPARRGDVRHSQADNQSLRKLFPNVSPTPLEIGLERTYNWFMTKSE